MVSIEREANALRLLGLHVLSEGSRRLEHLELLALDVDALRPLLLQHVLLAVDRLYLIFDFVELLFVEVSADAAVARGLVVHINKLYFICSRLNAG